MESFRGWLKFTLYAVGAALAIIVAFDYLTSAYEDLQEPWFFIVIIVGYSAVVSVFAALHNETLAQRRDGY